MGVYKLQGRAHLKDIGRFFRKAGSNLFRFLPGELKDMSKELLEAVHKYVPVDTGVLKSSLIAEANYNSIQVVARSIIQLSSPYEKEYAEYVEAGVFGKDKSRLIETPDKGGPRVVRAPESFGEDLEGFDRLTEAGRVAQRITHGYAQFMRAGIADVLPKLMRTLRRIMDPKWLHEAGYYGAKKVPKG